MKKVHLDVEKLERRHFPLFFVIKIFLNASLFFSTLCVWAQTHGVDMNTGNNVKFSAIGGPGYSPDVGFLVGADAVFTFSVSPEDTTARRSVVPFAMAFFFKYGGLFNVRPQIFLLSDSMRIFGVLSYINQIDNYYGVGYKTNNVRRRGKKSTEYILVDITFNPILLFRWKSSNFFYGAGPHVKKSRMKHPSAGVLGDGFYWKEGGANYGSVRYFNSGVTLRLNYDTRDIPSNPHKGVFFWI